MYSYLEMVFFYDSMDWKSLLKKSKREDVSDEEFEYLSSTDFLLLADATLSHVDQERTSTYVDELPKKKNYLVLKDDLLEELVKINFDAIITTNYTYELEYQIDRTFKPDVSGKNVYCIGRKPSKARDEWKNIKREFSDTRQLLHTFNRVSNDGKTIDIWHIHGEQRKKS